VIGDWIIVHCMRDALGAMAYRRRNWSISACHWRRSPSGLSSGDSRHVRVTNRGMAWRRVQRGAVILVCWRTELCRI